MKPAPAPSGRAVLLCSLLAGCAGAPRKPFAPAPARADAAAVYFYRPSEMTARLVSPAISADGVKLGKLPNDSYGFVYLPPGQTKLRSVWPGVPGSIRDDSVSVFLEAGKSYFLRVRYHVGKPRRLAAGVTLSSAMAFEDRTGLEEVSRAEGLRQLAGLRLCDTLHPDKGG